jgi:hydrogenase maturation protease
MVERGTVRILCLGNDLVADDAVGYEAAAELRRRLRGVDVVESSTSGLYLLDEVVGVDRLVVVDAVVTGRAEPGTIHLFHPDDLEIVPGGSPHYVGLFETLELVRALGLDGPSTVVLVCVEVADTVTIGGGLSPAVRDALPELVDTAAEAAAGVAAG